MKSAMLAAAVLAAVLLPVVNQAPEASANPAVLVPAGSVAIPPAVVAVGAAVVAYGACEVASGDCYGNVLKPSARYVGDKLSAGWLAMAGLAGQLYDPTNADKDKTFWDIPGPDGLRPSEKAVRALKDAIGVSWNPPTYDPDYDDPPETSDTPVEQDPVQSSEELASELEVESEEVPVGSSDYEVDLP